MRTRVCSRVHVCTFRVANLWRMWRDHTVSSLVRTHSLARGVHAERAAIHIHICVLDGRSHDRTGGVTHCTVLLIIRHSLRSSLACTFIPSSQIPSSQRDQKQSSLHHNETRSNRDHGALTPSPAICRSRSTRSIHAPRSSYLWMHIYHTRTHRPRARGRQAAHVVVTFVVGYTRRRFHSSSGTPVGYTRRLHPSSVSHVGYHRRLPSSVTIVGYTRRRSHMSVTIVGYHRR